MTNSRSIRPVAMALAIAMTLIITSIGLATPAMALGTRSFNLELLDDSVATSVALPPSGGMKIDSTTHRGYSIDRTNKSVRVFDLAAMTLTQIATIDTTLAAPGRMAIDAAAHRLVVGDLAGPSAAIVDIDPTSPSANKVTSVIGTGGDLPIYLAIDGDVVFAGDFDNAANLSRIDLRDGRITHYNVVSTSKSMVVDPATHITYVGLPAATPGADNSVMTISADGTATMHVVADPAVELAIARGRLILSTRTKLVGYDLKTLTATGTSPTFSAISGLSVDDGQGVIYGVTGSSLALIDSATLALDGTVPSANAVYGSGVDSEIHRIVVTGKHEELYSATPTVIRKTGADRYEVSATISRDTFAPMAPIAYVASGAVFSDALSASAAAGALGGAVLLVQKDAIPAVIDAELKRLKPQRIVVLGGLATIDASVETALKAYTPAVSRTGGADRFEVSAAVSHDVFGPKRPVVYIAAGSGFTDALSGSAAAGKLGGPVLLVARDSVPESILNELRRLSPAKIVVLGGTASIGESVVNTLAAVQSNTVRIAGADRFEVSAAVSHSAFAGGVDTVYVASGLTYPDALSGSAAAITKGSPILLLNTDSIPSAVAVELDALNPRQIIILGGPNSVSASVQETLKRFID